ncbi:MAG TPA: XRE family transcriptional regulator [Acidobacteriaceae bacterium]|jgi:SOS-response transcriptional repressor LexA
MSLAPLTLGVRISGIRKSAGQNQADFGRKYGVSQVAVSRWEKGLDQPSTKILLQMAEDTSDARLKEDLLAIAGIKRVPETGAPSLPPLRLVKQLRDSVAAGTPRATDESQIERMLPFALDFFPGGGELYALKVSGDSMAPIVPDGYIVIVDTSRRDPKKLLKHMVAAREGDGVTIKWLRNDGDIYMLVPQHTSIDYPVRIMRPEGDFSIVGEVVYIMGKPPAVRR